MTPTVRQLVLAEMEAAATVHRIAYDARLPWLAGRHTPDAVTRFFREHVFRDCAVWGAFDGTALTGIIAFRTDWIDQLYVLPHAQGSGVGSALLDVAKAALPRLQLWTFQRNLPARRFYERRGFVLVSQTDGARNEEREPDALYRWERSASGG